MSGPSTAHRRTANRDQVTAAALEILDIEGLSGLTMAAVARRVGFSTMAVYRHVENRKDLIDGAVETVFREIVQSDDDGQVPWLDGVERWMDNVRTTLLAHPWVATQLGTEQGGAGMPWTRMIGILGRHIASSGLSAHDQARALVWTTRLTIGVLILELSSPLRDRYQKPTSSNPILDELATVSDDDLWTDTVTQTRRFLLEMTSGH